MAHFLQIAIIACFNFCQSFNITSYNSFSLTSKADSTIKFFTFKISYDFKVHPQMEVTSTCVFAAPIFTKLKYSTVYVKIFYIDITRISGHKYQSSDTSSARPLRKAWYHCANFHETHKWQTALYGDLIYRISPKSVNKCGNGGYIFIYPTG
jgi:hypothetical protein